MSELLIKFAPVASAFAALSTLIITLVLAHASTKSAKSARQSAEIAAGLLAQAVRVRWSLTKSVEDGTTVFLLTNVGGSTAYGVELSGAKIILRDNRTQWTAFHPGEGVSFRDAIQYGDKEFSVIVTWFEDQERSGDRRSWRHTLMF